MSFYIPNPLFPSETEDDLIRNAEVKRRLIGELSLAVKEVFMYRLIMHQLFDTPYWGYTGYTGYTGQTRGVHPVITFSPHFQFRLPGSWGIHLFFRGFHCISSTICIVRKPNDQSSLNWIGGAVYSGDLWHSTFLMDSFTVLGENSFRVLRNTHFVQNWRWEP